MGLRFHVFNKLPGMWSRDHAGKTRDHAGKTRLATQ